MYSVEMRRRAVALLGQGLSSHEVGLVLGVDQTTACRWAKDAGMRLQHGRHGGIGEPSPQVIESGDWVLGGRLTEAGRGFIRARLDDGWSMRRIAAALAVAPSTVSREVGRGTRGTQGYRPRWAHTVACTNRARPKQRKLDRLPQLRQRVKELLELRFSPEQVAAVLKRDHPNQHDRQVSHETIYQALYVQAKGGLRHELTVEKALRSGRTYRRARSRLPERGNRSWIGEAHISARPAEAEDRAVPGHWEGDLVIGAGGRAALITLAERATRYTLIHRLPLTHDADTVTHALTGMAKSLPQALWRSLTWDQGTEMASHAAFTLATDCKVYFCDPHSPWQRGTNENTNGLIRDFFPKGTDFAAITDHDVAHAQHLLNIRPRATLGWDTPAERLQALLTVALTT